jgi:hypothetical protein
MAFTAGRKTKDGWIGLRGVPDHAIGLRADM